MKPQQGILPGLGALFRAPRWHPLPQVLERVKSYFRGFVVNIKEIFARRKHIADELEMGVSTLARYIRYLVETGWMKTVRRRSRHAVRVVLEPKAVTVAETSGEPCIEVKSEGSIRKGVMNIDARSAPRDAKKAFQRTKDESPGMIWVEFRGRHMEIEERLLSECIASGGFRL